MIDGLYCGWMAIDTIEEAQSWTSLIRFRNQVQQQTKSSTCQSFDINMIATRLYENIGFVLCINKIFRTDAVRLFLAHLSRKLTR